MPLILKMPATSAGYTGVSQAVGPVCARNGDENPSPCASEKAMLPVSFANGTSPTRFAGIDRTDTHAYATRAASATAIISTSDVAAAASFRFTRPRFETPRESARCASHPIRISPFAVTIPLKIPRGGHVEFVAAAHAGVASDGVAGNVSAQLQGCAKGQGTQVDRHKVVILGGGFGGLAV